MDDCWPRKIRNHKSTAEADDNSGLLDEAARIMANADAVLAQFEETIAV